jgi:hypothetical protein
MAATAALADARNRFVAHSPTASSSRTPRQQPRTALVKENRSPTGPPLTPRLRSLSAVRVRRIGPPVGLVSAAPKISPDGDSGKFQRQVRSAAHGPYQPRPRSPFRHGVKLALFALRPRFRLLPEIRPNCTSCINFYLPDHAGNGESLQVRPVRRLLADGGAVESVQKSYLQN